MASGSPYLWTRSTAGSVASGFPVQHQTPGHWRESPGSVARDHPAVAFQPDLLSQSTEVGRDMLLGTHGRGCTGWVLLRVHEGPHLEDVIFYCSLQILGGVFWATSGLRVSKVLTSEDKSFGRLPAVLRLHAGYACPACLQGGRHQASYCCCISRLQVKPEQQEFELHQST